MALCAIAFILSLSIANVQAAPAPTGTATSVSNAWAGVNINDKSGQVPLGSTVYVYWTGVSPSGGTVVVNLYDPNGNFVKTWGSLDPTQSGTPSFTASMTGNYLIVLTGDPSYHLITTTVASVSVFVAPEYALGALAALGACFASLLVYKRKSLPSLRLNIHI